MDKLSVTGLDHLQVAMPQGGTRRTQPFPACGGSSSMIPLAAVLKSWPGLGFCRPFKDLPLPRQPTLCGDQRLRFDLASPDAPLFDGPDHPAILKNLQVPHEGWQGNRVRFSQFGNRRRTSGQLFNHCPAGRIGKC